MANRWQWCRHHSTYAKPIERQIICFHCFATQAMSDYEDEEDELQLILEGRDVPIDQSDSDHSESEDELVARPNTSIKKKRSLNDSSKTDNKKRKFVHHDEDQLVNEEVKAIEDLGGLVVDKNNETESKVKRKVSRVGNRVLVKLDPNKLMSAKGIADLPQVFADIKFAGKGSELKDLNSIMFRLSHWSHRLFPSLTFDDFIDKCEQLGHKKAIKNFVTKIRYDMPLNIAPDKEEYIHEDNDELVDDKPEEANFDADFDDIIANSYPNLCDKRPEFESDDENNDQFANEAQMFVEDVADLNNDKVDHNGNGNDNEDDQDVNNIDSSIVDDTPTVNTKSNNAENDSIGETSFATDKPNMDENDELDEEEILNEINSDN